MARFAHNVQCVPKEREAFYITSTVFFAFGFACLHIHHVSTLFENDTHFSHLSTLEREMTFRSEMGLYYSFYKTLVQAPSYFDGLYEIVRDSRTEYPSVINALQRFNLYPEITISLIYRGYVYTCEKLNIRTKQCYNVDRGSGLPPVESCEGLGDPMYFYLEIVWLCSGLTLALIFLYGQMLSGSFVGGILAAISYLFNHSECTRVQWTPPLRESFAYPFCLLQMLMMTKFLSSERQLQLAPHKPKHTARQSRVSGVVMLWLCTWIFLILWQFAQFVLLTQVLAIFFLYSVQLIERNTCAKAVFGIMCGIIHATLCLFGNEFLLFSWLTCITLSVLLVLLFEPMTKQLHFGFRTIVLCAAALGLALILKSQVNVHAGYQDDMHVVNLLKAKFLHYKDFHTLLYTCSAEFDFISMEYFRNIHDTLLLPLSICGVSLVLCNWWWLYSFLQKNSIRLCPPGSFIDPGIAYNFLQLAAFAVMAILIMRLKLFLTPQLCLMVSLTVTTKVFRRNQSRRLYIALFCIVIAIMTAKGLQNVGRQRMILGEYSNVPMEELLNWINKSTRPNAVFAGPMPVMANVLLSTRRPIVNHPHYEDAGLRARTKSVYSVFSRKPVQEVFVTLSKMQVDFVVLENSRCYGGRRKGCKIQDLWDLEDPKNKNRPFLCDKLFNSDPTPFIRVFNNDYYVVLQISTEPHYVELRPPKYYRQ